MTGTAGSLGGEPLGGQGSEPAVSQGGEPAGTGVGRGPVRPSIARLGAGAVGVVYLLIGLIGFGVTGFDGVTANQGEALIGFDLNPFHNVVHLGIGGGLLAVALSGHAAIAEGAMIGGGLVYLLAAVLGFINQLPILSIDAPLAPDNFLHLFSGLAALAIGVAGALQSRAPLERA